MADTINILKPSGCFEIQKIIGISTMHGNCKSYQVQWAPTWLSGAHLIGCEDLIEQFEKKQKENVFIKIEIPDDEEQNKIENNPEIGETDLDYLQDDCGLTGLLESDNEEMMLGYDLHTHSVPIQEINKHLQDDVAKDSNTSSSPNNMHQTDTELNVTCLDSVIHQIPVWDNNESTACSMAHPHFYQLNAEAGHEMDAEIVKQGQSSSDLTEYMVVVGEQNNCDVIQSIPLQDVQNFSDHQRKAAVLNKSVSTMKAGNKGDVRNITSPNAGGSSRFCRNNPVKNTLEIMNGRGKIFQCHICKKLFSDPASLENHTNLHNHIYECIICLQTFELEINLRKHEIRLHSACDICKKIFNNMEKLKLHIGTHKTAKADPLECSYCEKRYQNKSLLVIHERSHTGERPFKCSICQKGFNANYNLMRHYKTHGKEECTY